MLLYFDFLLVIFFSSWNSLWMSHVAGDKLASIIGILFTWMNQQQLTVLSLPGSVCAFVRPFNKSLYLCFYDFERARAMSHIILIVNIVRIAFMVFSHAAAMLMTVDLTSYLPFFVHSPRKCVNHLSNWYFIAWCIHAYLVVFCFKCWDENAQEIKECRQELHWSNISHWRINSCS